jgi:hypothetical protein
MKPWSVGRVGKVWKVSRRTARTDPVPPDPPNAPDRPDRLNRPDPPDRLEPPDHPDPLDLRDLPDLRISGWLLLLCLLLVVWQPISFGLLASGLLNRLSIRGWPFALVLLLRLMVTALGIAAGLALIHRHPAAVSIAKASLIASAACDLFIYTTPFVPNNRLPGDTPIFIAVSLAYHAIWLGYLFKSKRVRDIYLT